MQGHVTRFRGLLIWEGFNEHLLFPLHHKHKRNNHLLSLQNSNDIDQLDVEKIITDAYNKALELIERLEISVLLKKNDIFDLNSLSKYVFRQLKSNSKIFDYSTQIINDDDDEFDLEEDEEEDEEGQQQEEQEQEGEDDNNVDDDNSEAISQPNDNDYNLKSSKPNFSGMRIFDEIEPCRQDSYFKLKINDNYKYIHKQSACWLLTDKNIRMSNDRLSRVMQSSRKDNNNLF